MYTLPAGDQQVLE